MKQAIKKNRRSVEDHVYEDITNSEEQNPHLLLQPERSRERLNGYTEDELLANRKVSDSKMSSRQHLSPTYNADLPRGSSSRLLSEKMSKDSGLSSGSSSSPAPHHYLGRQMGDQRILDHRHHHHHPASKHSYQSEREAMKKSMQEREDLLEPIDSPPHQSFPYDDYEVEVLTLK